MKIHNPYTEKYYQLLLELDRADPSDRELIGKLHEEIRIQRQKMYDWAFQLATQKNSFQTKLS